MFIPAQDETVKLICISFRDLYFSEMTTNILNPNLRQLTAPK